MGTKGKAKQQTDERANERTNERTSERTVKRANERTIGLNLVRLLLLLLCFCALLLLLCVIGFDVRRHFGLNFVCAQRRRAISMALQSGNQKGIAAFFSKQRSAPSSMASTSASSTASSSTGSSSQRIAQPLAGSELDVEEKSSPSSVDLAAANSYDSMSWAELRACCGKKHGNSISEEE